MPAPDRSKDSRRVIYPAGSSISYRTSDMPEGSGRFMDLHEDISSKALGKSLAKGIAMGRSAGVSSPSIEKVTWSPEQ